jgi:predicted PurR-regulated permease PerM
MSPESDPSPVAIVKDRALIVVASGTVLALLYFGRDVLIPITLALLLSLLMAPLIRVLRRVGLGHGFSVVIAVLALAFFVVGLATTIGSQVVRMAESFPQYQATINVKARTLREMSLGRMAAMQGEAGKVISQFGDTEPQAQATLQARQDLVSSKGLVPVEVHAAPAGPLDVVTRVFSSVWTPLETAGIVLVVLIFVLLEHEALRDRFIRLAGGSDLRSTTAAINDASARLSRFFVSQFAVNFGVGVLIFAGLKIIGLPSAPLWATLTVVMRFVPYVGVWLVAILATVLAAAVSPGWSLMLMTLGLFLLVEIVVAELVEPQLYGHNTGLSPLAVVVAAIFWSWLWGPVGLVVSTPLTLCLVVAGRHVKALSLLDILLGDMPALTMPQRFYQRALSGDSDEIIASARVFLKRRTFAAYCDVVLLPALQLGWNDLSHGVIAPAQQVKLRGAIVRVIESLGGEAHNAPRGKPRASVLSDSSLGRVLRQRREGVSGRWQGPLAVAPGSIVLCVEIGGPMDDLTAEILARILRELNIDARHLSVEDMDAYEAEPHPEATPDSVSMVYIVSALPSKEWEKGDALAADMRRRFPEVCLISLLLPELLAVPDVQEAYDAVDHVAHSVEEAAQQAITRFPDNARVRRGT